jgi:hypothetical protein
MSFEEIIKRMEANTLLSDFVRPNGIDANDAEFLQAIANALRGKNLKEKATIYHDAFAFLDAWQDAWREEVRSENLEESAKPMPSFPAIEFLEMVEREIDSDIGGLDFGDDGALEEYLAQFGQARNEQNFLFGFVEERFIAKIKEKDEAQFRNDHKDFFRDELEQELRENLFQRSQEISGSLEAIKISAQIHLLEEAIVEEQERTQEAAKVLQSAGIAIGKTLAKHQPLSGAAIRSNAEFSYLGQKNLREFFGYLADQKDANGKQYIDVDSLQQMLTKEVNQSNGRRDFLITQSQFQDNYFFEQFIYNFHEILADISFSQDLFLDNSQEGSVKSFDKFPDFLDGKAAGVKHTKYQEPGIENGEDTLSQSLKVNDLDTQYSQAKGVSASQGNALVTGAVKTTDGWEDAANVPSLLKNKVKEVGAKIRQKYVADGGVEAAGSSALISHYSKDQKLTIANSGNSRAVLFVKTKFGDVVPVRLTHDHNSDGFFEKTRAQNYGGVSANNVGRGFGYIDQVGVGASADERLISYEPDIYQYDVAEIIRQNNGTEAFLVTANEALYQNDFNEHSYAQALGAWFSNAGTQGKWNGNMADYLRDCAVFHGNEGNVTVLCSDVTKAPREPVMNAVFDGDPNPLISSLAADIIRDEVLVEERSTSSHAVVNDLETIKQAVKDVDITAIGIDYSVADVGLAIPQIPNELPKETELQKLKRWTFEAGTKNPDEWSFDLKKNSYGDYSKIVNPSTSEGEKNKLKTKIFYEVEILRLAECERILKEDPKNREEFLEKYLDLLPDFGVLLPGNLEQEVCVGAQNFDLIQDKSALFALLNTAVEEDFKDVGSRISEQKQQSGIALEKITNPAKFESKQKYQCEEVESKKFFKNFEKFKTKPAEQIVLLKPKEEKVKNSQFQITTTNQEVLRAVKDGDTKKASEAVERIFKQILKDCAREASLSEKETGAIMLIAIRNGGIGNSQESLMKDLKKLQELGVIAPDADLEKIKVAAIDLSFNSQKKAEAQKFCTGNPDAVDLTGTRLKRLDPEFSRDFLGEDYDLVFKELQIQKILDQRNERPKNSTKSKGKAAQAAALSANWEVESNPSRY